jgi:hypothetical protein
MAPTTIDAQSWVAFPVAPLTPTTPDQQKRVAVLSGIVVFELQGSGPEWTHEERRLALDDLLQAIFTYVQFVQRAPATGHHLRFVLEHTANVAAINSGNAIHSIVDSSGSQQREFAFAVDGVETNFIGHTIRCFAGLTIKVAVTGERALVQGRLLVDAERLDQRVPHQRRVIRRCIIPLQKGDPRATSPQEVHGAEQVAWYAASRENRGRANGHVSRDPQALKRRTDDS